MRLCTSRLGIVWDSGHVSYGCKARHVLLPTKTSQLVIQSLGRSIWFLRTFSQVSLTFWRVFLSRLIFEAIILSLVSLLRVFVGGLVVVAFGCACVISVSASLCVGWFSGIVQVRVRSGRRLAWGRGCWVAMC